MAIDYNQKGVSLFGYGVTTKAIAKHFKSVTYYDDKVTKPFKDEFGNLLRPSSAFDANYSLLEITSPGIAPSHPLIKEARNLISEYDLFSDLMPYSIWISGTNGKTTTTQMITHLLKDRGAISGGNIGTPLGDLDQDANIWVLETSSFTNHYTNIAKPNLYVLLPVAPDHLSWHGDLKEYTKAKLKPIYSMKEGEVAMVPKELQLDGTHCTTLPYSDNNSLAEYFGINIDKINFEGAFLQDALIALGVEKILFDTISYEKINSFTLDPHRQEKIVDKKNRIWINDSKATNIDATLAALETFKQHTIYLIVGGDDKGVDMEVIFTQMQNYSLELFCIGSNANKLHALASKYNIVSTVAKEMQNAVKLIDAKHTQKTIALLSPAAASFDQFSSYKQRGERFKEFVENLS